MYGGWGYRVVNGLTFEPKKTEVVLFTRKRVDWSNLPKLEMGGRKLPFSNTVKYLGITLDSRLQWSEHSNNRINKAKRLLYKVRNAAGSLWGLNPRMSIWFYRAIIRPNVSYGAIVWCRIADSKGGKRKLETLQRLALKTMGHFRPSTPAAGLEVITYTAPLWIHIKQEAALAFLRTQHQVILPREKLHVKDNRPLTVGHRQKSEEFLKEIGFINTSTDSIEKCFVWEKHFEVDTSSFDNGEPVVDGSLSIYTDGSKDENGRTGAGCVVYRDEEEIYSESWYLGDEISVFQSEVYVLKQAALYIEDESLQNETITILSDCRSALQAMLRPDLDSKQLKNTKELLNKSSLMNFVTLRWCKAHVGHKGNERADELAKEGSQKDIISFDTPEISGKCLRKEIKILVEMYWDKDWAENQPCRQTKMFFPQTHKESSAAVCKFGRRAFGVMVQFITGHNFLNNRQNAVVKLKTRDTSKVAIAMCRYCKEEEETTYHILTQCHSLGEKRELVFGERYLETPYRIKAKRVIDFVTTAKIEVYTEQLE